MTEVSCEEFLAQTSDPNLSSTDSGLDNSTQTTEPKAPSLHINDLPPEALSAMFHAFTDVSKNRTRGIRPLMLVCKYWHDTATRTPQLWSEILISLHRTHSLEKKILFARLCIRNSGALPLDLTIDMEGCLQDRAVYENTTSRPLPRLLRTLGGPGYVDTARWRSLELRLRNYPGHLAPDISTLFEGAARNLKCIKISNLGQNCGAVGLSKFLKHPRTLTILEVDGDVHLSTIAKSNLETLESLKMHLYLPGSRLTADTISQLTELRSLDLQPGREQRDVPFPVGSLELPRLEHLTIGDGFAGNMPASFELPSLRRLTIRSRITKSSQLPRVMPIELVWEPIHAYGEERRGMEILFTFYTSVERFVIPKRMISLVQRSTLWFSPTLKWIEVDDEPGKRSIYRVRNQRLVRER